MCDAQVGLRWAAIFRACVTPPEQPTDHTPIDHGLVRAAQRVSDVSSRCRSPAQAMIYGCVVGRLFRDCQSTGRTTHAMREPAE